MTTTQKKYSFILWVELVAFIITVCAGILYMASGLATDNSTTGLGGLVIALVLFNFIPALIWRLLLWLSIKNKWTAAPVMLTFDCILSFIGISIIDISLGYTISSVDFLLRIPDSMHIDTILAIVLSGTLAVIGWQLKDMFGKPGSTNQVSSPKT